MRSIWKDKRYTGKHSSIAGIIAAMLVVLLLLNQSMLVFAASTESESESEQPVLEIQEDASEEQDDIVKGEKKEEGSDLSEAEKEEARESLQNLEEDADEEPAEDFEEDQPSQEASDGNKEVSEDGNEDKDEDENDEEINITISIVNNTYPVSKGAAWDGTLVETDMTVPSGCTLMQALHMLCEEYGIRNRGTDGAYVSMIEGLSEFDGGGGAGWMGSINDWFVATGFTEAKLHNRDVAVIEYTCSLGEDLGASFNSRDKRVKAITTSVGTLSPDFNMDHMEYNLVVPEGTDKLAVYTTAVNRNYQVRAIADGKEYIRGAEIPVSDGSVIYVKCGDPSWPSMNSYEENDNVDPVTYKLKVYYGNPRFSVKVSGVNCDPELDREDGSYAAGDKVKVRLDYDKKRYRVAENGVKAFIGGSGDWTELLEESEDVYTIIMPGNDVEIKVECETRDDYPLSVTGDLTACTMTLDHPDGKYLKGEKVTFSLKSPAGKRINDFTVRAVEKESGRNVEIEHLSLDEYRFTMPGDHVVVFGESEEKEESGLIGYTVTTEYGKVDGKFTDESRTSICSLPERATEYDLSLDIDESEELFAVRTQDIFGNVKAYKEALIEGISAGTRNTALFGKDLVVTVLTKDKGGKTHTYSIRIKTRKNTHDAEHPDAVIEAADGSMSPLPYKKTLMTSGVQLYEVDYPTNVQNFKAEPGSVYLTILPTYEEKAESLEIRCKYATFAFTSGSGARPEYRWCYRSKAPAIQIRPGITQDIPIEIDYTLSSGEKVTRKYLYRITNGKYTEQRFKVLSIKGDPITPSGVLIDGANVPLNDVNFEDGAFFVDIQPGSHTIRTMKRTVDFTVNDDMSRPINTDMIVIETDTPEYDVTVGCDDNKVLYTVREANTGVVYYRKTDRTKLSLPPGRYIIKAVNDDHRYSRAEFSVTSRDVRVTLETPAFLDPEFVAHELDLLEEIQSFDAGNGKMEIYVPDYQTAGIVVTPMIDHDPDGVGMRMQEKQAFGISGPKFFMYQYFVQRNGREHSVYLKYEVYNERDKTDRYYSEVMELYMPPYYGNDEEEVLMPADVRTLKAGFGVKDGTVISGSWASTDELFLHDVYGQSIPVTEETAGITDAQLELAGYKVKYTLRYCETRSGRMQNVWSRPLGDYGIEYVISNEKDPVVFETTKAYNGTRLRIAPSIEEVNTMDNAKNGYYEVTAWFEDKEGNKSEPGIITVYKDGQPPDFRASLDKVKGVYDEKPESPEYGNEAVTLTISAQDIGAGLHEKPYSFDAGKTWTSENKAVFHNNTVIDLNDIWVRDSLGAVATVSGPKFDTGVHGKTAGYEYVSTESWFFREPPRWSTGKGTARYLYIDMEAPDLAVLTSFDRSDSVLTMRVKASDSNSGLARNCYSFDGGETWSDDPVHKVSLGSYSGDNIKVRDKAGNIASYDGRVWTAASFDGELPKIKDVRVKYGAGGGTGSDGRKWYQTAEVCIEAEAGGSPIDSYTFDGETYTRGNSRMFGRPEYIKAGTIAVVDEVGNVAMYDKDVDITNIDVKPPTIKSYSFPGDGTRPVREITTTISAVDDLSGGLMYAISPKPLSESVRGYPDGDLDLEWSSDTAAEQFKLSNVGRKYDNDWLTDAATYITSGTILRKANAGIRWGVRLWVRDAAGNISYKDVVVNGGYIDQKGPDISEVTTEYKYFSPTTGIVKVYVAATEPKNGSGLADKAYSFDGGKTWQSSNMTSIPVGSSIAAGSIKVRDRFGNISTYNKIVKTTLQDVIARIERLDPGKAKDRDYKEILDLYNQLTEREKAKVYNWKDFLDKMGNRKDQNWDDDFGDLGEPDDSGSEHGGADPDDPSDPSDPDDDSGGNGNEKEQEGGGGENSGDPSEGSGGSERAGDPDNNKAAGGNEVNTVTVALTDAAVSSAPEVQAEAGQAFREAEIEKKGLGSMLSQGMVTIPELLLLISIMLGAVLCGAVRRYRRFRKDTRDVYRDNK